MEMKIYERSLQALLSSAPRSRVIARLASLAQIGELARRLNLPSGAKASIVLAIDLLRTFWVGLVLFVC